VQSIENVTGLIVGAGSTLGFRGVLRCENVGHAYNKFLSVTCTDIYVSTALLFELFLCFALALFGIEVMQKQMRRSEYNDPDSVLENLWDGLTDAFDSIKAAYDGAVDAIVDVVDGDDSTSSRDGSASASRRGSDGSGSVAVTKHSSPKIPRGTSLNKVAPMQEGTAPDGPGVSQPKGEQHVAVNMVTVSSQAEAGEASDIRTRSDEGSNVVVNPTMQESSV